MSIDLGQLIATTPVKIIGTTAYKIIQLESNQNYIWNTYSEDLKLGQSTQYTYSKSNYQTYNAFIDTDTLYYNPFLKLSSSSNVKGSILRLIGNTGTEILGDIEIFNTNLIGTNPSGIELESLTLRGSLIINSNSRSTIYDQFNVYNVELSQNRILEYYNELYFSLKGVNIISSINNKPCVEFINEDKLTNKSYIENCTFNNYTNNAGIYITYAEKTPNLEIKSSELCKNYGTGIILNSDQTSIYYEPNSLNTFMLDDCDINSASGKGIDVNGSLLEANVNITIGQTDGNYKNTSTIPSGITEADTEVAEIFSAPTTAWGSYSQTYCTLDSATLTTEDQKLTLVFSDTVYISTLPSITDITIINSDSDTVILTSGSTYDTTVNSDTVIISISDTDINSIRALTNYTSSDILFGDYTDEYEAFGLCVLTSNYNSLPKLEYGDVNFTYTINSANPVVQSSTIDTVNKKLTITFDKVINISGGIVVTQVKIYGDSTPVTSLTLDASTSVFSTENTRSVILLLEDTDITLLKAWNNTERTNARLILSAGATSGFADVDAVDCDAVVWADAISVSNLTELNAPEVVSVSYYKKECTNSTNGVLIVVCDKTMNFDSVIDTTDITFSTDGGAGSESYPLTETAVIAHYKNSNTLTYLLSATDTTALEALTDFDTLLEIEIAAGVNMLSIDGVEIVPITTWVQSVTVNTDNCPLYAMVYSATETNNIKSVTLLDEKIYSGDFYFNKAESDYSISITGTTFESSIDGDIYLGYTDDTSAVDTSTSTDPCKFELKNCSIVGNIYIGYSDQNYVYGLLQNNYIVGILYLLSKKSNSDSILEFIEIDRNTLLSSSDNVIFNLLNSFEYTQRTYFKNNNFTTTDPDSNNINYTVSGNSLGSILYNQITFSYCNFRSITYPFGFTISDTTEPGDVLASGYTIKHVLYNVYKSSSEYFFPDTKYSLTTTAYTESDTSETQDISLVLQFSNRPSVSGGWDYITPDGAVIDRGYITAHYLSAGYRISNITRVSENDYSVNGYPTYTYSAVLTTIGETIETISDTTTVNLFLTIDNTNLLNITGVTLSDSQLGTAYDNADLYNGRDWLSTSDKYEGVPNDSGDIVKVGHSATPATESITINTATRQTSPDTHIVRLALDSSLVDGETYTLAVSEVEDPSGNKIMPNSKYTFEADI